MATPVDASRFSAVRAQAEVLDEEDSLRHLRDEFHIPTKADVKRKTLLPGGEIAVSFMATSKKWLNIGRS
jgi:kynureninase